MGRLSHLSWQLSRPSGPRNPHRLVLCRTGNSLALHARRRRHRGRPLDSGPADAESVPSACGSLHGGSRNIRVHGHTGGICSAIRSLHMLGGILHAYDRACQLGGVQRPQPRQSRYHNLFPPHTCFRNHRLYMLDAVCQLHPVPDQRLTAYNIRRAELHTRHLRADYALLPSQPRIFRLAR